MSAQERLLAALQDLDFMLKDVDKEIMLGFKVQGLGQQRYVRGDLAQRLEVPHREHYERARKRYGCAVTRITSDTCLHCFAKQPLAYRSSLYKDKVRTCQNCGVILYYPEE
jgi:predicted  nucleic acid-binding Zn-ribbon protein